MEEKIEDTYEDNELVLSEQREQYEASAKGLAVAMEVWYTLSVEGNLNSTTALALPKVVLKHLEMYRHATKVYLG